MEKKYNVRMVFDSSDDYINNVPNYVKDRFENEVVDVECTLLDDSDDSLEFEVKLSGEEEFLPSYVGNAIERLWDHNNNVSVRVEDLE
jgi:hypothetical protein